VQGWYREIKYYDWSNPGWRASTGHFTQLIWDDSRAVGCAVNTKCETATYVCHYAPAGNILGQDWAKHVRPLVDGGAGGGQGEAEISSPPPPTTTAPPTQPPSGSDSHTSTTPATGTSGGDGTTRIVDAPPVDSYTPGGAPPQSPPPPAPYSPPSTSPPPASPPPPPASPPGLSPELTAVLKRHNDYRAKHNAPPLQWDSALAAQAQGYADGCPSSHSHMQGVGENLAWGHSDIVAATNAWYDEVSAYSYSNPTFSSGTGHFTQLVWAATTKLGCGINRGCGMKTYVCQYSPRGNVMGRFAQNVGPPSG